MTGKQIKALEQWDKDMDKLEAKPPVAGSATGYASIVQKLEGIRDQLANLRDEIPTDYKGRRVDGVIWDMLGRINQAESIAKDEA